MVVTDSHKTMLPSWGICWSLRRLLDVQVQAVDMLSGIRAW